MPCVLKTCSRVNVPCVLTCSRANGPSVLAYSRTHVPTCLAYSCAHVSTCLACLRAHVPTCYACLRPQVATWFACSRAHVQRCIDCLRTSRVIMPCVLMYSCANVACKLTWLRANRSWVPCLIRLAWPRDHLLTFSVSSFDATFSVSLPLLLKLCTLFVRFKSLINVFPQ